MEAISAETVERMANFIREIAGSPMASGHLSTMREAQAIVAQLPERIDPDLLEAEKCAAQDMGITVEAVREHRGKVISVSLILLGIKRGRELAALGKQEG